MIKFRNGDTYTDVTPDTIGAAAASHTHGYAGSASAGGAATSAVKLTSSAGSATNPVYLSDGKPVACSYSLNKTVPSNAVFTDTQNVYRQASQPTDNNCQIWIKPSGIAKGRPMVYFRSD